MFQKVLWGSPDVREATSAALSLEMPVGVTPVTVSQDVHRILACRLSGMLASATSGNVKLFILGRLSNGAEPFRLQRVMAMCRCLLRHVVNDLRESVQAGVR